MSRSNKKAPRSMYGSRFSGKPCPGASAYQDDLPNGGKICKVPIVGKPFNIDKDGNCDDDAGCALAASGPMCPGTSRGLYDMKNGQRKCKRLDGGEFIIGKDGKCLDPNNCATSLTSALTSLVAGVKDSISCGTGYQRNMDRFISKAEWDAGARQACIGAPDATFSEQLIGKDGKPIDAFNKAHGKKSRSTSKKMSKSKKMCYSRKQKGKKSKKSVCLDSSAVMRLKRGARKGGKRSHRK